MKNFLKEFIPFSFARFLKKIGYKSDNATVYTKDGTRIWLGGFIRHIDMSNTDYSPCVTWEYLFFGRFYKTRLFKKVYRMVHRNK